jgi:hypothetical protein
METTALRGYPSSSKEDTSMKKLETILRSERGAWGWGALWLIGIPIPILLGLFLIRGCT